MLQEVQCRSQSVFCHRNRFTVSYRFTKYLRHIVILKLSTKLFYRLHRSETVSDSRCLFQYWWLWYARHAQRCIQSIEFVFGTQFTTVCFCGSSDSWHCFKVIMIMIVGQFVILITSETFRWRYKLLIMFKLLLLQKRVICFGSPVRPMCSLIMVVSSLYPELIQSGFDQVACVR